MESTKEKVKCTADYFSKELDNVSLLEDILLKNWQSKESDEKTTIINILKKIIDKYMP